MKVLLTLPVEFQRELLKQFESTAPEYGLLKNGVVTTDDDDKDVLFIFCEADQADAIVGRARKLFFHADSRITITARPEIKKG